MKFKAINDHLGEVKRVQTDRRKGLKTLLKVFSSKNTHFTRIINILTLNKFTF